MDLGTREAHISMPIPFPNHYPSIPEAPRIHLFTRGNGVLPPDEIRAGEVKPKDVVRYRECQKNHAASIGGHAVDGCGEFMPSGQEGSVESLKCAACGCHRNFHRRIVNGEPSCNCYQMRSDRKRSAVSGPPTPAPFPLPATRDIVSHTTPQMVVPLSSTPTDSDDPDASHAHQGSSMRKRFRTKFSAEQKEKMLDFAERLGWKIQKHDEATVEQFCNEVKVKRTVLKVWMHNNKHTTVKKTENGPDLLNRSDCTTVM